ncbi:MAG: vanadium-dependent haloperoxidase [Bryobacteraceae bacterium]
MSNPCNTPPPAPCVPNVSDARVIESFTRRFNAATREALVAIPPHTANGDEQSYPDKCGTYSKCIKQMGPGKVDLGAFATFKNALNSGSFADFEAIELGGARTLNGPMGSYAYTFCGSDSSQFGDAPSPENQKTWDVVPPAPALASEAYATELVELYWGSLLRDVAFTSYDKNRIAKEAAKELSSLPDYAGPTDNNNQVTPTLLFRGNYAGETLGPYLSQFLVQPTMLGALAVHQKYVTYQAGLDYMTDLSTWSDVQNGISTGLENVNDPVQRYLHNGRGLAAFTHVDILFQAYFTAYLVLESSNAPVNPGNPYFNSKTQNGFGTFGAPDFAATLAEVAKIAVNEVWYQKWLVHLRHRPEAGGALVDLIKSGVSFDGKPHDNVLNSKAVRRSYEKYGTYLLSQAFPEGSPAHPAYPTGHGAVGGACITILKFFFNGDYALPNPLVPSRSGIKLEAWQGADPLTVNGELHKLAHNISFGHGIHAGIHWRSDTDISMRLGEAVAISFLQDLACTYAEPFTVSFAKLDGSVATISNV